MNDLQTLTALEVEAMRQTNPNRLRSASHVSDAIAHAHEAFRTERELRDRLLPHSAAAISVQREDFTRAET